MRISVFGMGYVGCVSAACFADMHHNVIGVDVNLQKLDLIKKGQSPIIEPGLDELLAKVIKSGQLTISDSAEYAIKNSDVSMVCVGTPSLPNGSLDTHFLLRVMEQIGATLRVIDHYHVVTIRSTLLPGVAKELIVPILEQTSGKVAGEEFGVCVNPEFLRESSAIDDFRNPPFTLIGQFDQRSGDQLAKAYDLIDRPIYRTEPDAASMVKYASNAYHALKVAFANEIGAISNKLNIDSQRVMEVFCEDRSLNISKAYLRPGFAFGGSCLPKDVRALNYAAKHRDIQTPLLNSIIPSNEDHIQRAINTVLMRGKRHVVMLGLSFKPGTDDLRESPLVRIAETLIGKGYKLKIYDEEVILSNLFGKNKEYIERSLPHISELLTSDYEGALKDAETIIIGKKLKNMDEICGMFEEEQFVLDLEYMADWAPAESTKIV
ncbi:MAG: nucleotide sugar dehydrogenase [Deferribacteres bacterium]|nr:nucleotide sugar dehydrogenase [candidate division KSB1 bacterium]MCB9500622.1 nucleotide sugar dehydrogenase [Deferribacteres bacterium]